MEEALYPWHQDPMVKMVLTLESHSFRIEFSSKEVVQVSQLFLSLCFQLEEKLLLRNYLPEVTENAFPWKKVLKQRPKGYLSADIEQVQSIS